MRRRVLAASGVVRDDEGRFLLVLRRRRPEPGCWSVPGGRVEPGESLREAVAREVEEETGIVVDVGVQLWSLDIPIDEETLYEVHDFLATPAGGSLRAGDDAADVGWFSEAQMAELPLTADLLGYLQRAGLLTGSRDRNHDG